MTTDDWPSNEPRELAPHEAAAKATEQFVFAMKLAALAEGGGIRPEMFPRFVMMPLEHGRLEFIGDMTAENLRIHMANVVMSSVGLSALVMNRALEDTFVPKHPLDPQGPGGVRRTSEHLGDREAAQEIIYMFRNAVSHDALRPKWECKGSRAGVFHVTQLGITFDARNLDGAPVDMRAIGGLDSYVRLLHYCERKIRRAAGLPDPPPGHERDWIQTVDMEASVPLNAVAVHLAYRIEPNDAAAVLYSTRDDPSPVWLPGPEGQVTLKLVEAQRIYFETIGIDTRLHLDVRGYRT